MQCKDISDIAVLSFLNKQDRWVTLFESFPGGMPSIREVVPKEVPAKLVRAKMAQLIKRKLVDGCTCGCRGDFEITSKGVQHLRQLEIQAQQVP